MAWIFTSDGNYVNFNGGGNLWRLHKDSNCISWHWDESGDLFFDVYDQEYTVKAANIADVIIDSTPLTTASDFKTAIEAIFPGLAGGGGAVGSSVLSAAITLNDEQIKALPTTAIEIVPVAGVDKTYVVLFGFLRWNTTVAYTNVNADNTLSIGYGSPATGDFIDHAASPTQLRTGTGIRTSLVGPAGSPHPTLNNPDIVFGFYNNFPELDFNNVSLVVYADNLGSGNLTGGNAANTLKVTVYYVEHDL